MNLKQTEQPSKPNKESTAGHESVVTDDDWHFGEAHPDVIEAIAAARRGDALKPFLEQQ